jgi:hypothetical protein
MDDLHKNDKNVKWMHKLLTIPDETWNNEIPCQTTFWKKNKGMPMITRILLHDASYVRIGDVSGQRKFGLRGNVLKWHCFGEEAF